MFKDVKSIITYLKQIRAIKLLFFLITILLSISVSSCGKKTDITIYTGPNYQDIGEWYVKEGLYEEALNSYNNMLEQVIKNRGENSSETAAIYDSIGEIYIYLGKRDEALKFLEDAIRINTNNKDELGLASNYNQMGKIYINIGGDSNEGLSYFDKAEEIYKKYSWDKLPAMAGVLSNKGKLYKNMGENKKALDCFGIALDIYHVNNKDDAKLQMEMGQLFVRMKKFKEAEIYYNNAEQIISREKDLYLAGKLNMERGSLHDKKGEYVNAINEYKKALNVFKSNQQYELDKAVLYNNLGCAYAMNDELKKAVECITIACKILNKTTLETDKIVTSKKDYKYNLRQCYLVLNGNEAENDFEKWYQKKMSEEIEEENIE